MEQQVSQSRSPVQIVTGVASLGPRSEATRGLKYNSPCRTVLVTDAMAAACAPDGRYALGGVAVDVQQGQARAVEGGSIAGSTLTLDAALRYTVNMVGIPLPVAVEAPTGSPAAMLGLSNVGRIEAARRADLVALDRDLEVKAVMRAGLWVSGP